MSMGVAFFFTLLFMTVFMAFAATFVFAFR